MKVYCTRPLLEGELAHLTELPDLPLDAIALEQWKQQFQSKPCEQCGMPLILGDGRYVPLKALGNGGFGYTFLAYDLNIPPHDCFYPLRAIKQFRSDRLLLSGQIKRALQAFKTEAKLLDQLKHPQIPKVYEAFQVQANAYFVQEYVPGENLQQLLTCAWNETSVREVLCQLLEILEYLHTRSTPVIHRDIKPSNIIKAVDGTYHLIDFGSVRQVIAESTIAGQETQILTPGYAAPEQYRGQVGFSSDFYALAKTCICLFTGQPDGDQQLIDRNVSPRLRKVLQYMSDPDPAKRPPSVKAILQQLDPPSRLKCRRPFASALIAGCAIAPLVVYGLQFLNRPQIPQRDWKTSLPTISAVSKPPPLKTYFYGGSTTAAPLATAISALIPKSNPDLILKRKLPAQGFEHSEEGIDRLTQGELDFALSSKNIQEQQAQNARDRQVKLALIPIAITSTAVIVNPTLAIDGITQRQLELIQDRKIVNWKDLGGPDLPIRMYATDGRYLRNPEGGDPKPGLDFIRVNRAAEAFQKIQNDPGGFYVAPTPVVVQSIDGCPLKALKLGSSPGKLIHPYQSARILSVKQCQTEVRNQVNLEAIQDLSYPLKSNVSVIVLQDGGTKQWVGEYFAYVLTTAEARGIMQQLGYVPLTTVAPEL